MWFEKKNGPFYLQPAHKVYAKPENVEKHLYNHKGYKFYDED
jgi:hypothetical protein